MYESVYLDEYESLESARCLHNHYRRLSFGLNRLHECILFCCYIIFDSGKRNDDMLLTCLAGGKMLYA